MPDAAARQKDQIRKIRNIRGRALVMYGRAEALLTKLADLLDTPKCHRMPGLIIAGDTNNGKTTIVEAFSKKHKPEIHLNGELSYVPVLLAQAPPTSDVSLFYNALLDKLQAPFRPSSRSDQRLLEVLRNFDVVGLRMLIIDEIQHILVGGAAKQRQFLQTIKYLANELRIPIVVVGTRDAFNAVHADPQLANRFEPFWLPRWRLDEDYLRLLASFELLLPLECEGQLTNHTMAAKILSLTDGLIGEIADLVTKAARRAVACGSNMIDSGIIDSCGYLPPSARRQLPGS
ncbi:MAG TPA: TniB family NTP-binding protein [Candidatus Rubrimentiphilum sp.]|nr:TniB family NTP-binding protein [Candidatus Rubrimentiphilum sp.]